MIDKIRRLLKEYYFSKFSHDLLGPQTLYDRNSNPIGCIDRINYKDGSIFLEGWVKSTYYRLAYKGSYTAWKKPDIIREDVNQSLEADLTCKYGFSTSIRCTSGHSDLHLQYTDDHNFKQISSTRLPKLNFIKKLKPGASVIFNLVYDVARLSPLLVKYFLTGCKNTAAAIRGSIAPCGEPVIKKFINQSSFFSEIEAPLGQEHTLSIVDSTIILLPVYNALHLAESCIERVINNTNGNFNLLVIDDCSTDERVKPFLKHTASKYPENITVLYNETNLGFVKSVNKGLAIASEKDKHVVLLNSDAFVPPNWLDRLMLPIMESDDSVASVTPLSNNAEIMSAPFCVKAMDFDVEHLDGLDEQLKVFSKNYVTELPTAIGFCMAMNKNFLKKVGNLDLAFEKGYGEEVDWCLKATKAGGKHIGIPNLFVAHVGTQSFDTAYKIKAISASAKIINERYPFYNANVRDYIESDTLSYARLYCGVQLSQKEQKELFVYIGHNWGGGAEIYLQKVVENKLAHGNVVIILRASDYARWCVEFYYKNDSSVVYIDNDKLIEQLFLHINKYQLIYSCGVGFVEPLALPRILAKLEKNKACSLTILFHDYYPITPDYTLLDRNGQFNGAPIGSKDDEELYVWQNRWRRGMRAAEQIIVFSEDSKNHVTAVYPCVTEKVLVKPHNVEYVERLKSNRAPKNIETIGVLGNIGPQKGAKIVSLLSAHINNKNSEAGTIKRIVVAGNITPEYELHSPSIAIGDYSIDDLPKIINKYKIDCWLMPSIWPETFSYVTHECIGTGLPVFCFDIGAQANAVKEYKQGLVLDFELNNQNNINNIASILRQIGKYI